jgi:hypothetical protein
VTKTWFHSVDDKLHLRNFFRPDVRWKEAQIGFFCCFTILSSLGAFRIITFFFVVLMFVAGEFLA